ncbi:uncharacterized protein BP01DRAFT_127465 [Aspergillus saccharolyticus JOP 1030-1]|uniref:Uncharacterized protein n=1 Tax=Aspergillus saccharolyticus JOP 1030-1 TaxID=1450539 RepID=A0A318Z8K7_9EURO|nr:hypothetical protein BP01DRAFT_127465 [Aspergillus saccharolyticus JOP 1030-1]PYH42697.1 hypothetical protein BP01DRAFT_127465 [Aspergillus saccharolyticus JOP 1030-1]
MLSRHPSIFPHCRIAEIFVSSWPIPAYRCWHTLFFLFFFFSVFSIFPNDTFRGNCINENPTWIFRGTGAVWHLAYNFNNFFCWHLVRFLLEGETPGLVPGHDAVRAISFSFPRGLAFLPTAT